MKQMFGRAWFPGVVVVVLLGLLMIVDASSVALWLGAGVGSLFSPVVAVFVVGLALLSQTWWHTVLGIGTLATANQLFFTSGLSDDIPGWAINAGIGTFVVGVLIISLVSGFRNLIGRSTKRAPMPSANWEN